MSTIFTEQIKNLRTQDENPELFQAVAEALCAEMDKQGLWHLPPNWLDGYDWNNWHENIKAKEQGESEPPLNKHKKKGNSEQQPLKKSPSAKPKSSCLDKHRIKIVAEPNQTMAQSLKYCPDAFTDLLFECYPKVILKELEYLQGKIYLGHNIDGLVLKNIHLFVTEIRRKANRGGYAVFQNAKVAVELAMDKGVITSKEPKINNNTLLTFSSSGSTTLSGEKAIYKALHRNNAWTEEIQLKLSKLSKPKDPEKAEELEERFCEIVCHLKEDGIAVFLFKSLVDAMKEDVRAATINERARHYALKINEQAQYDMLEDNDIAPEEATDGHDAIIQVTADPDYYSLSLLCDKIRADIDQSDYQERVKENLHRVLAEFEFEVSVNGRNVSSHAKIARRLQMASATFDGYMKKLRKLVLDDYSYNQILQFLRDDRHDNGLWSDRCECVRNAIDQSELQPQVREELHTIFTEIKGPLERGNNRHPLFKIADFLGMGHATLEERMNQLHQLVEQIKSNDFE